VRALRALRHFTGALHERLTRASNVRRFTRVYTCVLYARFTRKARTRAQGARGQFLGGRAGEGGGGEVRGGRVGGADLLGVAAGLEHHFLRRGPRASSSSGQTRAGQRAGAPAQARGQTEISGIRAQRAR
jgi:hypothetical protein